MPQAKQRCPNDFIGETWHFYKNLHQAGIEPAQQAAYIAKSDALTIVARPSINIFVVKKMRVNNLIKALFRSEKFNYVHPVINYEIRTPHFMFYII